MQSFGSNDLRSLTDAEQLVLVRDILEGNNEAVEIFWRCTKRLLVNKAWKYGYEVFFDEKEALYTLQEPIYPD